MQTTFVHSFANLSVFNFRCTAKPGDKPYPEIHRSHALAYVRRGSFGCRTLGKQHELISGAVLVGKPGREYMATHDHHDCGDECLSVMLSPELAESLAGGGKAWDTPRLRKDYALNYYAVFLMDADGNNVVAVCMREAGTMPTSEQTAERAA